MKSQFVPIPIARFISAQKAQMDLFLKLTDSKHLKVVKAGDGFDRDRLRNYQNFNAETLYVRLEDFPQYVDNCLKLVRTRLNNPSVGEAEDFGAIFQVGEVVLMSLKELGVNSSSMGPVLEFIGVLEARIHRTKSLRDIVDDMLTLTSPLSRHAMATLTLALFILEGLRWSVKRNREAVALAAFLKDYTLLKVPEVFVDPSDRWSESAKARHMDHPEDTAKLLLEAEALSDVRVAEIIRDHHELPDGSGFPRGIQGSSIYPMALPVIMADRAAHLLLDADSPLSDRSFKTAFRYLKNREENFYPPSYWEGIQSLSF